MDNTSLASTAKLLAALDLSDENDRIAAIQSDIASMEAAIELADGRRAEIAAELNDYRDLDARAVADALLADVMPRDAARASPDKAGLQAETRALGAGTGNLRRRIAERRSEIRSVQDAALYQVSALIKPAVDVIAEQAREAAERIISAYASLVAINISTRAGYGEQQAARHAVQALTELNGVVSWRRDEQVPGEVMELLSALNGKGAALPIQIAERVSLP